MTSVKLATGAVALAATAAAYIDAKFDVANDIKYYLDDKYMARHAARITKVLI
jgi:hypothetical protein